MRRWSVQSAPLTANHTTHCPSTPAESVCRKFDTTAVFLYHSSSHPWPANVSLLERDCAVVQLDKTRTLLFRATNSTAVIRLWSSCFPKKDLRKGAVLGLALPPACCLSQASFVQCFVEKTASMCNVPIPLSDGPRWSFSNLASFFVAVMICKLVIFLCIVLTIISDQSSMINGMGHTQWGIPPPLIRTVITAHVQSR